MKKIVIAALVRGYKDKNQYKNLLKRNKNIYKNIILKSENPFDNILFHEGNIPLDHQEYIKEKSPQSIKFIDVSETFDFDNSLIGKIPDLERFDMGYRLMCRFNFFYIWKYVKNYDYIIRIDEDVIINKFDKNLISNLDSDFIFGTAKLSEESHEFTNKSLPEELKIILNSSDKAFYNHLFPYTNFYISNIKFWTNVEIETILKSLAENELQIINRWGDLPIIGCILNFKNEEIKLLQGIEYFHLSHRNKLNFAKKIIGSSIT